MINYITTWLLQPSHIALVISEVLALGIVPAKYSGLIRSAISFTVNTLGAVKNK